MPTDVIEHTQLVKIALTQVNEMNSKGCQHQQTFIRLQFKTEHAESARKAPINRILLGKESKRTNRFMECGP